jgi:cysteine-rich repeat protein
MCGDGQVDEPEVCDDGDDVDGNGCNVDCQPSGLLLWSTTYAGLLGFADEGLGCDVDGTGSIYVIGETALSATDEDLWLRKYAAEGEPLWTQTYAGSAKLKDQGRGVVVDPAELVYAAGLANVTMQENNVVVRKHAADGMAVWTKSYNGAAMLADIASAAVLTKTGDLLVGGATAVTDAGNDTWLRKYSPAGAVLWTRNYAGPAKGHDETNALAVTPDGGYFYAAGIETVVGEGRNIWLGKYDIDGNLLWSRLYNGAASKDDYLYGAVALADGGVVVCGYETSPGVPWSSFLRRYDMNGLMVWTEVEAGPDELGAHCYGLDLASNGDLLLAGMTLVGVNREPRLRRLTVDGVALWSTTVVGAGKGASQARCVREAPDGTVVAVGGIDDGTDGRDAWIARFTP